MELSTDIRLERQDEAPSHLVQVKSSSFSAVQQQGYSATIILQNKEKLEQVSRLTVVLEILKSGALLFGESKGVFN